MEEKELNQQSSFKDEIGNLSSSIAKNSGEREKTGQEKLESFIVHNVPASNFGSNDLPAKRSTKYHETLANTSFVALEAIGMAIAVFEVTPDNEFSIITANQAYCDITGCTIKEIAGRNIGEWLEPELAHILRTNLFKCIESKKTVSYKVEINLDDGISWYKSTITPQLDHDGHVKFIVLATSDITHENHEYLAAVQEHANLMNSFGEFSQMYSTAAHDLRSPICELDVILNLISMRVNDPSDELRQMFSMADTLVEKALQYLDDVLQNYQLTSVSPREDHPIALDELCRDIRAILDPRRTAIINCSGENLSTDRITMQILLRNLIDNALKHNHDHQNLHVDVSVQQHNGDMLLVSVEDNGKGLEENQKIIREQATDNCGYGLPAARRLAVSRGGNLWVSECPKGAKVCFLIPGQIITEKGNAA